MPAAITEVPLLHRREGLESALLVLLVAVQDWDQGTEDVVFISAILDCHLIGPLRYLVSTMIISIRRGFYLLAASRFVAMHRATKGHSPANPNRATASTNGQATNA